MYNTNITKARTNLFTIADMVIDTGEIVNVSTKKGNFIMLSDDEYRSFVETIYLYSIPGYREKLIESIKEPMEDRVWLDEVDFDEL